MRARLPLRLMLLAAALLAAGPWAAPAQAICPTTKKEGGGTKPPPDPPPPPLPTGLPPPTTPNAPPTGARGPVTPRGGTAPLDAPNDASWEGWWDLNGREFLPRVRRQAREGDEAGSYAATLDPRLRPAVDLWIEALEDADPLVRQAAAGALAVAVTSYRASDTLAALRKASTAHDDYLRDLAGLARARRHDPQAALGLLRILKNRSEVPVSRAFAALGLLELEDADGLEALAAAAADLDEPELAGVVLIALGQTGDLRHLPALRAAVERRAGAAMRLRRVRADAIVGLGKLGCRATVPLLAGLLDDREKAIARSAALALGGFPGDPEAVRALRQAGLASEDAFVRGFSAVSLGRLGDASVLPSLGTRIEQDDPSVRGFALLALGLFRSTLGAPLLREPLLEDPRTGRYGAAALAAGLSGSRVYGELLAPAVDDPRSARAPACGAMGLALLGEKAREPAIRARSWLDSALWRPGFAEALALLDPADQSSWLLSQLSAAKRSSARQALVRALAYAGGPVEAGALVELWKTTPAGDTALRTRLVNALVPIVTDRETSFARRLLVHTCYLQPNIVLAHLDALP